MDIEYLKTVVLPQRELEIKEGKNLGTHQPVYAVLEAYFSLASGHSDYSHSSPYSDRACELGYIDLALESEDRCFSENSDAMLDPEAVTRIWHDRFISFHLTSKSAHDYLEYQKHNLTNAFVYVFSVGYNNFEMSKLLQGE